MPNTVLIYAVLKNGEDFVACPVPYHFPCTIGEVDGQTWYINSNNDQTAWEYPTVIPAVAPAVGFEVGRVMVGKDEIFFTAIHIPSAENLGKALAELCDACCSSGSPPDEFILYPGTIPTLAPSYNGIPTQSCVDGTCTYKYVDLLPASGNFTVTFNCNGTQTTTPSRTIDNILAYVSGTAPFSTYGTWALSTRTLSVSLTACANGVLFHTVV